MITKRTSLLACSLLGGALLLGTAGLVLAQDPTPAPSATTETPVGMMNGQGMGTGQGMMNGQGMTAGQGMMNGQGMTAGQMPDMTAMHAAMGKGAGQMPDMTAMHAAMGKGAGQMPAMTAMHAAMGTDGTFHPELMQSMHDQAQPGN